VQNTAGLGELLAGGGDVDAVLRPTRFDGLSVITAGAQAPNPADLLIGEGLAQLVTALQSRFDQVIVDGPAVADLADAPLIASAVGGVVYVVAHRSTPAGQIRAALARLDKTQTMGGVLTLFANHPSPFGFGAAGARR
jgi:Mrp family chromosome partitioning ATPase